MRNLIPLILLSLFFIQCYTSSFDGTSSSNSVDTPPNPESDKCYAKCKLPEKREVYQESYIAFTGDTLTEKVDYETIQVELKPKGSAVWKQKKVDENCASFNPDDCLIWCWIEDPAQVIKITILNDTIQSKNFKIVKLNKMKIIEGGTTDWKEVLCPKDITPNLIADLQEKLIAKGYDTGEKTTKINKQLKQALIKFQKENGLPIGLLNIETLEALGIKY